MALFGIKANLGRIMVTAKENFVLQTTYISTCQETVVYIGTNLALQLYFYMRGWQLGRKFGIPSTLDCRKSHDKTQFSHPTSASTMLGCENIW